MQKTNHVKREQQPPGRNAALNRFINRLGESTLVFYQQLTGRLAALSRFISRLGERTLSFYQLLRKGEKFEWTEEARQAFAYLKKTLSTPPILAVPKEREKLYLYIATRNSVVSTTLVVESAE